MSAADLRGSIDDPAADDTPDVGGPHSEETRTLVDGLLGNAPAAIGTVAGWARGVAAHRAWGFETIDDVVQATLLAVVQNLREGRYTEGNFRAYVRCIAKNISVSSYRRSRVRGVRVPLDEATAMSATAPESGKRIEQRAMARRILARLDDSCRRIIDLAYLRGFSRKEIAAELGVSETAAKVRLFRCLQKARVLAAGEEAQAATGRKGAQAPGGTR